MKLTRFWMGRHRCHRLSVVAMATSLLVLCMLYLPPKAHALVFASSVEFFDTGTGDDIGQYGKWWLPTIPEQTLGAPDGIGPSIGETGTLIVGFGSYAIADGPGADITIYGSGNADTEPGKIYAGWDLDSFVEVGVFDQRVTQMSFDLAGSGLSAARYVKIWDLPGGLPGGIAFDVDAIGVLNYTLVPEPTSLLALISGIGALAVLRRRRA